MERNRVQVSGGSGLPERAQPGHCNHSGPGDQRRRIVRPHQIVKVLRQRNQVG